MAKVTLNCDSITEELSLAELHDIIHGLNLACTWMYHRPSEFSVAEQDRFRELRSRLIDFCDDITPDDLPF